MTVTRASSWGSVLLQTGDWLWLVTDDNVTFRGVTVLYLFRGARQHEHGPAVDARMRQACDAVDCSWARYCEQHPRHASQVPTGRCCIACCLLVAEADEADANCLRMGQAKTAFFAHSRRFGTCCRHSLHALPMLTGSMPTGRRSCPTLRALQQHVRTCALDGVAAAMRCLQKQAVVVHV